MTTHGNETGHVHGWIDNERAIDRKLRFFGRLGWGTAIATLLLFAGHRAFMIGSLLTRIDAGLLPGSAAMNITELFLPLIYALGAVGLLTGVLATVGSFMRFRTASLDEIQLRLAVIEEALLGDGGEAGRLR